MVEALIALLIVLIVVGVVWWIGQYVIGQLGLPPPALIVWNVVVALVFLLVLLKFLLPLAGVHAL